MDEEPDTQCYFCRTAVGEGSRFEIRGYTICLECRLDSQKLGMIE